MNNKYDLTNFAALLESFSVHRDLSLIDNYLYGVSLSPELSPSKLKSGDSDRSLNRSLIERQSLKSSPSQASQASLSESVLEIPLVEEAHNLP